MTHRHVVGVQLEERELLFLAARTALTLAVFTRRDPEILAELEEQLRRFHLTQAELVALLLKLRPGMEAARDLRELLGAAG